MNKRFTFKNYNEDFKCLNCHNQVSTDSLLSGVINRNHCPYCLYSRHLDLHQAGDRLSACKSPMQPVALTFKRAKNKYGSDQGELMLVHRCAECGKVSINRIAADDDAEHIYAIFETSLTLDRATRALLAQSGVQMLRAADAPNVRARLFGYASAFTAPSAAAYESNLTA